MSYAKYRQHCANYMEAGRESENESREDSGKPVMAEKPEKCCPPHVPEDIQTHVHEFTASVMIEGPIPHNHRFAGVTSERIPWKRSHIHAILVNTDFYLNHLHEVGIRTGPAIDVGFGKHVHAVEGETTINLGHDHEFVFTTLIENPLEIECK